MNTRSRAKKLSSSDTQSSLLSQIQPRSELSQISTDGQKPKKNPTQNKDIDVFTVDNEQSSVRTTRSTTRKSLLSQLGPIENVVISPKKSLRRTKNNPSQDSQILSSVRKTKTLHADITSLHNAFQNTPTQKK